MIVPNQIIGLDDHIWADDEDGLPLLCWPHNILKSSLLRSAHTQIILQVPTTYFACTLNTSHWKWCKYLDLRQYKNDFGQSPPKISIEIAVFFPSPDHSAWWKSAAISKPESFLYCLISKMSQNITHISVVTLLMWCSFKSTLESIIWNTINNCFSFPYEKSFYCLIHF